MITAYHRPQTLDEALALLTQPNTLPLGGGTLLSQPTPFDSAQGRSVSVVDLQALGLDSLRVKGNDPSARSGQALEIGATCTLQALFEFEHCPDVLKTAIKLEAPINIRNMATVAGTLVASDGRSTFATMLLAMDAKVTVVSDQKSVISAGEFLLTRPHKLITEIAIPLNTKIAFEFVSRTPADKPIICAALAQWNSGRTRLTLGGYGKSPMLAMDGTEADGLDASINSAQAAAQNAYHEATDEWASAEYRMDVAATLAKRCLESLK
ncbi:MAG: FAD binding domain-containing protein [Chloroflexi bacterium]|nr:FAD binding domain-containing protein [Chloroflexota bacterium]